MVNCQIGVICWPMHTTLLILNLVHNFSSLVELSTLLYVHLIGSAKGLNHVEILRWDLLFKCFFRLNMCIRGARMRRAIWC
jgi:hypothetical protein